jgi:hypothetical protein
MPGTAARLLPLILCLVAGTVPAAEQVDNPATPRDGVQDVVLQELWRVGGDDPDVFFGMVPRVTTDAAGNVYILDSQQCRVSVYDRDGGFLRSLFREGEGPGEVREARDMVVLADGRVGLLQEFPPQISFVTADGLPAGRVPYGGTAAGHHSLTACAGAGAAILVSGTDHDQQTQPGLDQRTNFLTLCGTDGAVAARFAENRTRYDFADFRFIEREHIPVFWWSHAAAADGSIYAAGERDRYAIGVFDRHGERLRTITRAYEPLRRTAEERGRLVRMIESALAGVPFAATVEVDWQECALAAMHRPLQVHPDGSLWVLSGRGVRPQREGVMVVFDVFDAGGVFTRQVALHAPHDGRDVGVFLAGADRVLVVKGYFESLAAQFGQGATLGDEDHEPEPPEVICYRMQD